MNPKPKTILIVDDDEGMRDTLNAILRRDYRVLRAATGEAALAILNREDVDLMLLDVRLPGIDGFDVLRIVKENYSLIEVIMISAITRDRDRRQGDEVRRLPLRDEGLRLRDDPLAGAQRERAAGSEPPGDDAERPGRRPGRSRVRRRAEQADARHRRPGREGREALGDGADSRRERHGQGAARAAHPSRERERRRAVHRREPRCHSARARRKHAVRARARVVHRRAQAAARQVRAGIGRNAVSRRDRRSAARAAGEAAARDPGRGNRAGRRRQSRSRPISASSPRPTSTSKRPSRTGDSAKTCSTASTSSPSSCLRFAIASRICRSSRGSFSAATRDASGKTFRASRTRR